MLYYYFHTNFIHLKVNLTVYIYKNSQNEIDPRKPFSIK